MTFLGDALFGGTKKIYRRDFNKTLRKIPTISRQERKYLNKAFRSDLRDGLSEFEVKKRIEKLRRITNDPIDSYEANQVKRELLGKFKK